MIIIPSRQTKKINQNNLSKVLGDIWSSFNLDLQSNLGVIKVSPRMQLLYGTGTPLLPVAFSTFNSQIFTILDTLIFKNSAIDLTSTFAQDAGSGAITTYTKDESDLKTFNQTLCASADTKLMSLATNGTWTQRATLTSGSVHKLLNFIKFNRLYFIDNFSAICSLDTSWSRADVGSNYAIDIGTANGWELGAPYTIDSDGTDIWIGTMKTTSASYGNQMDGAYILRWDGISSQITTAYKVKARGILALCKDDRNIMHAIDTNGALLQFTGSGFEEIGRLPLHRSLLVNAAQTFYYNQFVHPNGFQFTRNGTFIVLVNNLVGDNAGTIKENLASGIWEFSKDTGFVHRQSLSYNPIGTSTITDYGQNRILQAGALMEADLGSSSANGKPTIICGALYYTSASATNGGIFVDDPFDSVQKYGYFVTSWLLSPNLKDNWNKIATKYRKLLDSADKIWVKYRTTEAAPTEISITWVNTTSFTTATDVSAMKGYEVEIIQGTGSGKCAHITSVVHSGSYTVTLDETFTGVTTGTAKARVQAWVKTAVVADQVTESILKTMANTTSERVQIKCCMQFTGEDELYELIVINNQNAPLV